MKISPLFSTLLILVTYQTVCLAMKPLSEIPRAEVNTLFLDRFKGQYFRHRINTTMRPNWNEECYRIFNSPNKDHYTPNDCIYIIEKDASLVKCKPPNKQSKALLIYLVLCECKKRIYNSEMNDTGNSDDVFYIAPMDHGSFYLINNPKAGGPGKVIKDFYPYPPF